MRSFPPCSSTRLPPLEDSGSNQTIRGRRLVICSPEDSGTLYFYKRVEIAMAAPGFALSYGSGQGSGD